MLSKPKPGRQGVSRVEVGSGNRLVASDTETFTYDVRDQLSTRRDRRTGTTTHYVYDSFDMLVRVETRDASGTEVEPPWQYAYDALGRRTEVRRGGYRRQFYWDGDRLAAEVMPNGALRVYEYAGHGALVPLAFTDYASADASPESGKHYTVFTDPVGQPLQIEDAKGQLVWFASRVDPYGHIEVHPASQLEYNLRWPGHYYDPETALHYNRYRYYDPALGRYLQTDPLGYEGSPTNLYGYPANPLTDVDVLGLTHPHADDGNTPPHGPAHGGTEDLPDNTFRDSRGRLRDVDSGRYVTDPHATGDYTPDVLATKTRNTAMDGAALDPADPRVARALADRDAAMTDRNRLLAAGDERGAAQAQARANKATEHLGNMAADAAVQRAYPDAKMPPLHSGEGPGTFDRVYENGSPPPQHIIAEGKGGTATNSSSRMGADGQRHQQGSPGYRQSVTDNMANSSNSAAAATGQALQDSGSVAYVEVHQPITTTTAPGGATSSTLGPISGSTYGPGRPRTP